MAIVMTMLLAVTMLPVAGIQSAHADEPAAQRPQTSGGDVALGGTSGNAGAGLPEGAEFAFGGLIYRVTNGAAALVGFEEGASLEGAATVPERVSDGVGSATVAAVDLAEGQVADGVAALSLPQTVESIETRGLASALPNLASIEIVGNEGAYSSAAGMLFLQERGEASSDGSTALLSNAELVWAPPAMVVARIPIECKAVAEGAFADAAALETVMAFGVMESIAEGAFSGDQVNRVTIVVPITNYASASEGEGRVTGSVQLSEGIPTSDKKRPWFDYGFDSGHIVSGAPFGEIDGVVAVSEEGVAEERSLITPLENGRSHLDLTPEEAAEKAERRGVDPDAGLSFSYQASMDLSVRWSGDVTATPAHLEIPAYATIDGVKYQVTAIEPSAFAGAVFLESLVVPEGITTIGESAFENCSNLKSVQLPSTLRTIDYAAFRGCSALASIAIPEAVTMIGAYAFEGCLSLAEVNLPQSLKFLGSCAFGNIALDSLAIPEGVVSFDDNALAASSDGRNDLTETSDSAFEGYALRSSTRPSSYVTGCAFGDRNTALGYTTLALSDHGHVQNPNLFGNDENNPPSAETISSGGRASYGDAVSGMWNGNPDDANTATETWGVMSDIHLAGSVDDAVYLCFYTASHNSGGVVGSVVSQWGSAWGASDLLPLNLNDARLITTFRKNGHRANPFTPSTADVTDGRVAIRAMDDSSMIEPPTQTGGWYIDNSIALLNKYQIEYLGVDNAANLNDLRSSYTVEDETSALVEPARAGCRFLGWTGPGYTEITPTSQVDLRASIAAVGEGETTLEFEGHWQASTARFVTGTGQHVDNISYYSGDAPDLPSVQRTGFWFAGWYPTTGAGWWEGKQDGRTLYSGKMPAEAHGDVTFNAVWTPKAYTVRYDTEASKAGTGHDGNRVVNPPQNKTFLHPSAANAISPHLASLKFGIGDDGTVATDLNVANNHYFDLTNVQQSWCTDYALDVPAEKLGAYPFVGWCKIDDLAIGTVPGPSEGGNQRYWTDLRERGEDGSFTDTNYFFAIFGEGWSEFSKEQCATPYTVYGVWGSTSESTISLKATQPSYTNNLGEQVVTAVNADTGDKRGSATRGTESIRFRENHGFIGQAEATDDSSAEALHTGTPERRGAHYVIDSDMNLKAPVRYGFEFLGWGEPAAASGSGFTANEDGSVVASTTDVANADGKIYIAYDEAKPDGGTGFTITEAGAALIDSDGDAGTHAYAGPTSWSAYWATRTVDVTMRIPSHAVASVDMTGESTKTGHPQDADHPYNTKGEYTFKWTDDDGVEQTWEYAWREGSASETQNGATSGWYITDKSWKYYDVLEYPAFDTQKDRYSYDGWYEMVKSSITDSTDKAIEDLEAAGSPAMLTPIATYESMVQPNTRVRVTGLPESQGGLTIDEGYFLTGQGKNGAGTFARTLWLWTSPIRINVASPIGVYLCTTNSYGQAVDPFVVGNDRRTQLEAQAQFQVATGSHDLQLVGVTAEDVTAFGYKTDDSGNVVLNSDGSGAPVVDADSVTSSATDLGMASRILTPKRTDKTDNLTYDAEGSRMFWVSPVPTATADQTGVVYESEGNSAQGEAGKVAGSSNLVGDEATLVPDVEKRRYFGCGYKHKADDGSIDMDLDDNDIADELDSSNTGSATYDLSDFVLRRYDNYQDGTTDGLALVSYDEDSKAATYRFYYGLDMRRADFNLAGLQEIIENSRGTLDYNSTFDQPLLRVKFTFAAARNDGISYFSARGGEDGAQTTGISDETVITVGAPN